MTVIHSNLNNFSGLEGLFRVLPKSNEYEFTSKKVFRKIGVLTCSCGCKMVHNGYDYARKKGFGKVKIGKQICLKCGLQYHEDKSFWKELLFEWQEIITCLVLTLRDSHVSWETISKIMFFLIPCSKGKVMSLFERKIAQFKYPQENYVIVNYDEQHPKRGRCQKFRLTLLNYETGVPIAEKLCDNKSEETVEQFLRECLDADKEIIIVTDCNRAYPNIFKRIWGDKVTHQKCLLHLNKLVVKDFGKNTDLFGEYNKYLLLDIFYNRKKELKYLERLLKKQERKTFPTNKEKKRMDQKIKNKVL